MNKCSSCNCWHYLKKWNITHHISQHLHLFSALPTGKSCEMEKPRWSHGWPNNQWRAGDAPQGWIHRRVQAWRMERDLRLWGCLHTERDTFGTDPRQTGQYLQKYSVYIQQKSHCDRIEVSQSTKQMFLKLNLLL